MSGKAPKVRMFLAAIGVVAAAVAVPGTSSAQQTLVEFLWGGAPEYGGSKRQVVSFDRKYKVGQVVVSFGDRRLYHVEKEGQATSYPIAVPREQSRWEGTTSVSMKRENPDWRPTPEMLRENPRLPTWVPGGHPMNPMGVRALYLGSSTYRIHGTDAPWTIGEAVSKGCIRMLNEDVIYLYPRVPVGAKVIVTWERFQTGDVQQVASASPGASSRSPGNMPRVAASLAPRSQASSWGTNGSSGTSGSAAASDSAVTESAEDSSASTTAAATASNAGKKSGKQPPKEGFFIYPEDESHPVEPEVGMVTRYTRKVGAGAVSSRAGEQKTTQVR
jgi:lipoprotein-anchoring transpeptidase ErfK/SrfK